MRPVLHFALALLVIATAANAEDAPLFAETAPLELTLELPIRDMRNADRGVEFAGAVILRGEIRLKAKFSKRGHSRLEACSVPPLWVDLAKNTTAGTVFEGQNKLKLVTPCELTRKYENLVASEYLNYRILNLVSDMSYRVRLAKITFTDSDKGRARRPYLGFFVEHKRGFTARTGLEPVELPQITPRQLNPAWAVRFEIFAFMVSHIDWSILDGPQNEDCCHNAHLFAPPAWAGAPGQVVPLGYDFDRTGSVNPPYGDPPLGLRSWRHRLYRGRCWDGRLIDAALDEVLDLENDIRRLILEEQSASERRRRQMWKFIAGFFEIAKDPQKRQESIHGRCRPLP